MLEGDEPLERLRALLYEVILDRDDLLAWLRTLPGGSELVAKTDLSDPVLERLLVRIYNAIKWDRALVDAALVSLPTWADRRPVKTAGDQAASAVVSIVVLLACALWAMGFISGVGVFASFAAVFLAWAVLIRSRQSTVKPLASGGATASLIGLGVLLGVQSATPAVDEASGDNSHNTSTMATNDQSRSPAAQDKQASAPTASVEMDTFVRGSAPKERESLNDIDGDGVLNTEDCSPMDPLVAGDFDGDGYYDLGCWTGESGVFAPSDDHPTERDCDDTNPAIHPAGFRKGTVVLPEVPASWTLRGQRVCDELPKWAYDGLDNDCDGVTDGVSDYDEDGLISREWAKAKGVAMPKRGYDCDDCSRSAGSCPD